MTDNRALIVLASYDFESLQLTLKALDHTVSKEEKIVIILNGKRNYAGEQVERIARAWAIHRPEVRHVIRPLCAGSEAYSAITETLAHFPPLANVDFICKIDDDVIPLHHGWLPALANTYAAQEQKGKKMGFVTGLINNNCWGFGELVSLYNKQEEYAQINNYTSKAGGHGERLVPAGKIDTGMCGTVWQYPYLAWWIHQWTTLDLPSFVNTVKELEIKEVPLDVHYSIGCIFFKKSLWKALEKRAGHSKFDELLLHQECMDNKLTKWAVMNQPMVHLFYFLQRGANKGLVAPAAEAFASFFKDESFTAIRYVDPEERAIMLSEEMPQIEKGVREFIQSKRFSARWKNFKKKFKA